MTLTSPSLHAGPFRVQVHGSLSTRTVAVSGEVDTLTAPAVRAAVDSAAAQDGVDEVLVDLRGVTFLDSAGICALAAGHGAAAGRSRVRLLCSPGSVVRVLQLTGLWDALDAELVEG
jgi:anti-sigma B factor antagonist